MSLLIGTNNISELYLGETAISQIYLGTDLIYNSKFELIIFDNGLTGYTWQANGFTRPNYTSYASGYITHVSDASGYLLIRINGSSEYNHNGHVRLASPIVIPTEATRMNIDAYAPNNPITVQFGVLPSNAANVYSTANGGQLTSAATISSSTQTTYTLTLNSTVKGQTLYPVITGRGIANCLRQLVITKVWFD